MTSSIDNNIEDNKPNTAKELMKNVVWPVFGILAFVGWFIVMYDIGYKDGNQEIEASEYRALIDIAKNNVRVKKNLLHALENNYVIVASEYRAALDETDQAQRNLLRNDAKKALMNALQPKEHCDI